jgi:hypothetical protein
MVYMFYGMLVERLKKSVILSTGIIVIPLRQLYNSFQNTSK